MASVTAIPATYAKFITALAGEAIAYVQLYGTTWHLQPALVMLGAALAVLGVPNASVPAVSQFATGGLIPPGHVPPIPGIRPPDPPGNVTITPPATDRPTGGLTP